MGLIYPGERLASQRDAVKTGAAKHPGVTGLAGGLEGAGEGLPRPSPPCEGPTLSARRFPRARGPKQPPQRARGLGPGAPAAPGDPAALRAGRSSSPAVRRGGRLEPAEVISCACPRAQPGALPLRSGRGAGGGGSPARALNGALGGTAELCAASLRAALRLQPLPAPPTATPAAGERRPGGRSGRRRERRKVSGGGGGAPRARVSPVRGGDARELAEGLPGTSRSCFHHGGSQGGVAG
nr:translation initiation factor IF-2-like [Oryctolagus cuniculus]